MLRNTGLIGLLGLALLAAPAQAQLIDCSGGCTVTKYGLSGQNDFRFPDDSFAFSSADMTGSHLIVRNDPASFVNGLCGGERDITPVFGQVLLREQDGCVPTDTVGCPVEIPQGLPGLANASAALVMTKTTAAAFGGVAALLAPQILDYSDVTTAGTLPVIVGSRFTIGGGPATRIDWDEADTGGLANDPNPWAHIVTRGNICCNSSTGTLCDVLSFTEYPNLAPSMNNVIPHRRMGDWIFTGGPGTSFRTDPDYAPPGAIHGVCQNNREVGCNTAGVNPCPGLGDVCDVTEPGYRVLDFTLQTDGQPVSTQCGIALVVLQGTPAANCSTLDTYLNTTGFNGDPGPSCDVLNFGGLHRTDANCDGLGDADDNCPFLTQFDAGTLDTNGDGRGDECQCGDQTADGRVNVADIIATNSAVFDAQPFDRLCDADLNFDVTSRCNVGDILGQNAEIFAPLTARCAESPVAGQ